MPEDRSISALTHCGSWELRRQTRPLLSEEVGISYQSMGLLSASMQRGEPFSGANLVAVSDFASQPSGRVSAKGAAANPSLICEKPTLE